MSNQNHGVAINQIQMVENLRGKSIQLLQQLNCRRERERETEMERSGGTGKVRGWREKELRVGGTHRLKEVLIK